MRRATEFLEAATGLLDQAGINYAVEYGKHLKIRWIFDGHKRLYVMAISSGDINAIRNIRAGMRRQLRQDGVL
jgi:hypothetical protein